MYANMPSWVRTYSDEEIGPYRSIEHINGAYGGWYLAYQRIPKDNVQAVRQGAGLYAMQGFRCAIFMRDFDAARRYWALALGANPEFSAAYAQIALEVFFHGLYAFAGAREHITDANAGSTYYLSIPEDIRRTAWNAAKQSYSGGKGNLSMKQVEDAAQAGTIDEEIASYMPETLPTSVMYCPVFYSDFNFTPFTSSKPYIYIPYSLLKAVAEKANQAGGNIQQQTGKSPRRSG
jgi:hypothetical protein